MNSDILSQNFATLVEAPGGFDALRQMILQLAVRGKLVSQNPDDEPAEVLLERIAEEKERLIEHKIIRNSKKLPVVKKEEQLFSIPKNWKWVRLGQFGDWGSGSTPNRKNAEYYDGEINWFKSGELSDGYIDNSEEKISERALSECPLRMNQPGNVLIAMYGATIGKVAILEKEATTNQAVCACRCFEGIFNEFLLILLKAYRKHFSSQGAGGAQPNISRTKIINTVAPLPPIAEQHRIVEKVDRLMALCDRLEENIKHSEEVSRSFAEAIGNIEE